MNDKKDAGYIIIVVTVILVALSLMGMTFLNLTSVDFTATDNYVNSLQADMAARAGLDYATYVLKMDKYGTDTIVYNNNSYQYRGTSTLGYDENYDAYTEEWLGTGTGKIFCNATSASNDVDNNGDSVKDSKWLDAPFSLDRGLKAQYAILIEDVGESRINVNATGNVVGVGGSFAYGTGATTYDIRLQDVLTDSIAKNAIGSTTGRCGANGAPGSTGTTASQFQPRNLVGDDRPFNVLDAADICFGTCTSSSLYKSRLRNIINNETLFQSVRGSLTAYSFDSIITNKGTVSSLQIGNNYYRLNVNTASAAELAAQLRHCVFGTETLMADQIAAHILDYRDTDDNISVYNGKYGLEVHPFINELFYATATAYHRIELINPFNRSIGIGGWKLLVDRGGTVTTHTFGTATISAASSPSNPTYFALGDNPAVATLTTNLIVSNLNIYDYDDNGIPIEVVATLKEPVNNVIVDQVYPSAYINTVSILGLIDTLIQRVQTECPTIPPGGSLMTKLNHARDDLAEVPTDCDGAEPNLESFINEVDGIRGSTNPDWKACVSDNADEFISRAQYILDTCEDPPSARASIGQRKIPIIERSDNWTGSSTNHTIGTTNLSFNNIRQLVIANKNIISLGELGHLLTVGYNTNYSYTLDASYATSSTSNFVDNAKMNLFGGTFTTIPDYFTVLDPKNDAIDDDADGAIGTDTGNQSGDIDGPEIQVPGRININTASAGVLSALPGTSTNTSLGTWSALIQSKTGYSLLNNIINARPYSTVGALTTATGTSNSGMNYFGTDNVDNDGDGFIDEKDEKDLIFTSISNLITTHSNVFAVYVTARIVNSSASQTFAEKKLVAIVDRSVNPVKIRYFRWMTEW
ncbi:MAG TPA: hypothetical protein ACFYEF_01950 [Candidatus Wunengus sp. YC63]|uniref:hypothetical protein n=1 Tax=unclassified Candidatus Wunengus TaxID=3367695 RepID=UPI0040278C2D